jgi:hypothetical protein
MRHRLAVLILLLSASATAAPATRLVRWVNELTDVDLSGRATGVGAPLAAEWLESTLTKLKMVPAGEDGYAVSVAVPWRAEVDSRLAVGDTTLAPGIEFQAANFSDSGKAEGTPIFVGYGISSPRLGLDEYADIDVRGRIVVALTGVPDFLEPLQPNDLHLGSMHSKAAVALAKGARALVLVNDPLGHGEGTGQRPDEIFPFQPERSLDGIIVLRVPHRVLTRAIPSVDFAAAQATLASKRSPVSGILPFKFAIEVNVEREFADAKSLIAKVPNTSGPPLLLMAHYDGLNVGAFEGPPGYVGADDNASGVAVLLEVASRLAARPTQKHSVYVIFHDAEELGLHGSTRTSNFLKARGVVGSVINLDMVGRLGEAGLKIFADPKDCKALGALTAIASTCKEATESHSDHLPFLRLGYSVSSLSTGKGVDYHRSTDTAEKLNFNGMSQVADMLEKRAR